MNPQEDPIAQMNKSVQCLYLELPESIANDVKAKWDAAYNLLSKEISEKDEEIAKYAGIADAMLKVTDELTELRKFKAATQVLREHTQVDTSSSVYMAGSQTNSIDKK